MTVAVSGRPHLVVVGMMGVGKTTVATSVADRLGLPLRDSDLDVERLVGATGAQLAEAGRVDDLHRLEEAVLLGSLAFDEPHVIAAAGWVVESPLCREILRCRARVVLLRLPIDGLHARIAAGDHRRRIPPDELREIERRRSAWFDEVADLVVDASEAPGAIAERIVDWW